MQKSRRNFLKYSGFFFAGLALGNNSFGMSRSSSIDKAAETKKPNILLITADDLGPQLGCYGDKFAKTPNLDKMAKQGVMFQNAWVTQASCSPSRGSIHTGLYPHQNKLVGLCHRGYSMDKEYPTISTVAKKAGYRTGVVGKFHIEPKSAAHWDFKFTDFDVTHLNRDVAQMADISENVIAMDDKPFFLMVNFIDPHRPFVDNKHGLPKKMLTKDEVKPFDFLGLDAPEIRKEVAGYYNCVSRLDTGVGYFIELLEKNDKLDNTLIIFLGDHGPPFTRAKTTCYNAALEVPFLVKWAGVAKKGLVRNELISAVDIMPTIYDITGINPEVKPEGSSLLNLLQGKNITWRGYNFGEYTAHQHFSYFPRRTVRDKKFHLILNLLSNTDLPINKNPIKGVDGCKAWKVSRREKYDNTEIRQVYNRYLNPPAVELYDLENDPEEFNNLADDPAYLNKKNELLNALKNWRIATDDPLLDPENLKQETLKHYGYMKEKTKIIPN